MRIGWRGGKLRKESLCMLFKISLLKTTHQGVVPRPQSALWLQIRTAEHSSDMYITMQSVKLSNNAIVNIIYRFYFFEQSHCWYVKTPYFCLTAHRKTPFRKRNREWVKRGNLWILFSAVFQWGYPLNWQMKFSYCFFCPVPALALDTAPQPSKLALSS